MTAEELSSVNERYEALEASIRTYNPNADFDKIRRAFATELKKTTKIIIAQRIASVCDADQIIVMDDGKISAVGKHEDLMENSEIYRDVYLSQQEGGNIDG